MGVVTRWRAVLASALVLFGVGGAALLTQAAAPAGAVTFNGGLIANGDFSNLNTPVPTPPGYLPVNAGNTSTIPGWTVTTAGYPPTQSVDVVSYGYWGNPNNDPNGNSIDLAGSTGEPGGISQTVATMPYEEYSLSFYSAVNGDDTSGNSHTMGVTVNGTLISGSPGTTSGSTYTTVPAYSTGQPANGGNMTWVQNTVNFFATSNSTQIEFDDTTSGDTDYGPVLDDVSLVAVPDVITPSGTSINPQTLGTSFTVAVATFTDSYSSLPPTSFFAADCQLG